MGTRRAAPGEGARSRLEHFTYVPTPRGSKPWYGWAVSEPVWVLCHPSKHGTKVCTSWFTYDRVACGRCAPTNQPVRIGYLGLWREVDLRPSVVIVYEDVEDACAGVGYGTYCEVFRSGEEGSMCVVRKCLAQKKWNSTHPARQQPADITPSLLEMWSISELTEWYKCQAGAAGVLKAKEAPAPDTRPKKKATDYTPMNRAAAVRYGAAEPVGGDLAKLKERLEAKEREERGRKADTG